MFRILKAYGIFADIIAAIKIMYMNTSSFVLTPEGMTKEVSIDTEVLQVDPVTLFLFLTWHTSRKASTFISDFFYF